MSDHKKVRKERIKILRDFIPSKLFAESNLPEVDIIVIDKKRIKKADISLALSSAGFLPGKPTFRIRPYVGSFIPLDNLLNTKRKDNSEKIDETRAIITKISTSIGNNEIMLYSTDSPKSYNKLRLDEYKYLLNEVLNKESVLLYPVRKITVLPFYLKTETYCSRWLFYMRSRTNFEFDRIKDKQFYVYLDKSNAYARYSVFSPEGEIIPRTRICRNHGEKVIEIKGNVTDISIFHGVYAIDVRAALRGKFKRGGQGYCLFDIPINSTCITPTKGCSYVASFVKIFTDSKGNPVILGYEIKNTKLLNLDLDIDEEILSSIISVLDSSLVNSSQDMGYRAFSLNTIIVNALRHYLSHDLVILYYLSSLGFTKFDRLINLLILLNDIFGIKAIVDIIKEDYKKVSQELIEKMRVFENELKQPWVLVLRYILTTVMQGGRLEKYRMFHEKDNKKEEEKWNRIKNRLEHILNKYEKYSFNNRWYYGVILDVIKHTYSHHLIRSVSLRLNVNPEKFTENYREMDESFEISIFERDSGGIGILEKVFDIWKNEKQSAATDLILSSGKCLVGTPEDLLHFALVNQDTSELLFNQDTDDSIRRAIRMIVERLGIVVTPDEFEETIRLWRSIYKEALRLVQVLKNASKTDSENLLKEVHKLRYELEKEIRRFPEMDELIAYLIKELGRYPTLDKLFRALLRANAQAMSKELDNLKKLYGEDYVDKFINDVIYILKSRKDDASNDSQKEILDCVTKKRRNNNSDLCKSIISMLKLMGRVIRGVLMRISLLSCNGACGMCYVNTKSCSRFGAPFIQQRTLDRRALKILASELIKKGGKELNPEDYYKHNDIDVIELGGKQYLFRCD